MAAGPARGWRLNKFDGVLVVLRKKERKKKKKNSPEKYRGCQVPREGPSGIYRDLTRAGVDQAILSLWRITVADVHSFLRCFLPHLCTFGSLCDAYHRTLRENNRVRKGF